MDPQEFYDWRSSQPGTKNQIHPGVHIDHMSQVEAAEYFGVTRQTISNWERAATPIPKLVEMIINGQ
jgi:DNA-binding transcriptional regulator YiaG